MLSNMYAIAIICYSLLTRGKVKTRCDEAVVAREVYVTYIQAFNSFVPFIGLS